MPHLLQQSEISIWFANLGLSHVDTRPAAGTGIQQTQLPQDHRTIPSSSRLLWSVPHRCLTKIRSAQFR